MHRFFLYNPIVLTDTNQMVIDKLHYPELLHQLVNVLRITKDTEVIFFDSTKTEYLAQLVDQTKNQLHFQVHSQQIVNKELPFALCLAQAIPHATDKWEWLLQKGTEIGVSQFIPLITQHTQRQHLPKAERMQKIITEAVEQCGRTTIPTITEPVRLSTFKPTQTCIFASLRSHQSLLALLNTLEQQPLSSLTVLVGPEGGFSEEEEQNLIELGAIPYSLGSRVLRLETAALASLSIATMLKFSRDQ